MVMVLSYLVVFPLRVVIMVFPSVIVSLVVFPLLIAFKVIFLLAPLIMVLSL